MEVVRAGESDFNSLAESSIDRQSCNQKDTKCVGGGRREKREEREK
jgi:hypothetical protein